MGVVYLDESLLINEKDIYYNKDKFDSGEINLCFITGLSGSGKSTMSREMTKQKKIERYELDDLMFIKDHFTMNQLKQYGDLIYSFFNGVGKKYYLSYEEVNEKSLSGEEYEEAMLKDFVHYAMKYADSYKNRKYVVEGVWIFCCDNNGHEFFRPSEFDDYAFYIKGTSLLISKIRAANRDKKDAGGKFKQLYAFVRSMVRVKNWKFYYSSEQELNIFRNYFKNKMKENKE